MKRYPLMLALLLLAAVFTQYLTRASERERVPPHEAFHELPAQLGNWRSSETHTLTPRAAQELGADDYLSRTYVNERGATVFLFVAYYGSQRQRRTYHSPQNCLPGAGWAIGARQLLPLGAAGREINEYVIEKDETQMLALYWYQGRGRTVASEYWGRLYTISDAVTRGRTDGALVRVLLPLNRADDAHAQARRDGLEFVRLLMPLLPRFIPD